MWLDQLIVVDDEISSSFLLDNEGKNAIIGGRCHVLLLLSTALFGSGTALN
jgi:hypothetical protein